MKTTVVVKMVAAVCALFSSSALLAAPPVVSLATGDKVRLVSPSSGGSGYGNAYGGGVFGAVGKSVLNGDQSFQTFCIEFSEHISYNTDFYVGSVSVGSTRGGVTGGVADAGLPNGFGDRISAQTAFLYTKFREGTLSGFTAGNATSANALQLSIWYLEGEIGTGGGFSASPYATDIANAYKTYLGGSTASLQANTTQAESWVALANTAVALGGDWYGKGIGNVRALNLYSDAAYTRYAQDQLYLQPVPEPETYAMMLAGLGLIGFVAGRRRRKLQ